VVMATRRGLRPTAILLSVLVALAAIPEVAGAGAKKRRAKKQADKKRPAKPKPAKPKPATVSITAGDQVHTASDLPDPKHEGRILGSLTRCPGCTIELLSVEAGVLQKLSVRRGEPEYQLDWLKPGAYTLSVAAAGKQLFVPNIVVQAGSYTRLDIAFVPSESPKQQSSEVERWPTWKPRPEPKVPVPNFKPKSFRALDNKLRPAAPDRNGKHKKNRKKKGNRGRKGKGNKKGKNKTLILRLPS